MDEDTTGAAWAALELEEEAQELLRADPAWLEWLESIEAWASCEDDERRMNDGDSGF